MATSGNIITKGNFGGGWTQSTTVKWTQGGIGSWWGYFYISAPSFIMHAYTNFHWLQSGKLTHISVDFYNRSAGAWQNVGPAQEIKGNGTTEYNFFHNRDAEPNKGGYNYRDNANSRVNHLFKVNICLGYNNDRWGVDLYMGGVGLWTDSEYNSYGKNRLIKSLGRLSTAHLLTFSNYTQNDSSALSTFNPGNNTGSYIPASYDSCIMPYWA